MGCEIYRPLIPDVLDGRERQRFSDEQVLRTKQGHRSLNFSDPTQQRGDGSSYIPHIPPWTDVKFSEIHCGSSRWHVYDKNVIVC